MEKLHKSKLEFKHIIGTCVKSSSDFIYLCQDYYLNSSEQLSSCLYDFNAKRVLDSLSSSPDNDHSFNESIIRVLCLNQAISKLHRETQELTREREAILT